MIAGFNSWSKMGACLLLACLLSFCLLPARAQEVASSSPDRNQAAGPVSFGGGLTRDTLEDAARPSPPNVQPRRSSGVVRYRPALRTRPVMRAAAAARWQPPGRRNVFVSFIYAWNGWVIHTFHTTTGTVLLRRIGFKG